jgi:hypothetical protein
MRSNVLDLEGDDIATAQLAVDARLNIARSFAAGRRRVLDRRLFERRGLCDSSIMLAIAASASSVGSLWVKISP